MIVRRIFDEYAAGGGYRRISELLNTEGVPSPRGGTWDLSGVRSLLLNETYLGHRVWNRTRRNKKLQRGTKTPKDRKDWVVKEGAHEAIITQEQWDAAHERRGQFQVSFGNRNGNHKAAGSVYMLTGLMKCAECGGNYVMVGGRRESGKTRYYRCSYHVNRGNSVCGNKRSVRQDVAEAEVLETLSHRLLTPEMVEAVLEEVRVIQDEEQTASRVEELENQLQKTVKEIQNLTNGIKAAGAVEELVKELRTSEARRDRLRAEIVALKETQHVELDIDTEQVLTALNDLQAVMLCIRLMTSQNPGDQACGQLPALAAPGGRCTPLRDRAHASTGLLA